MYHTLLHIFYDIVLYNNMFDIIKHSALKLKLYYNMTNP